MAKKKESSPNREIEPFLAAAARKKGQDLVALDMRGLSSVADFFVIISGRSTRQVSAIADDMLAYLGEHGLRPIGVEGLSGGQWVLLDYGNVIVHVFDGPVREFYDMESLWADAPRVDVEKKKRGRGKSTSVEE